MKVRRPCGNDDDRALTVRTKDATVVAAVVGAAMAGRMQLMHLMVLLLRLPVVGDRRLGGRASSAARLSSRPAALIVDGREYQHVQNQQHTANAHRHAERCRVAVLFVGMAQHTFECDQATGRKSNRMRRGCVPVGVLLPLLLGGVRNTAAGNGRRSGDTAAGDTAASDHNAAATATVLLAAAVHRRIAERHHWRLGRAVRSVQILLARLLGAAQLAAAGEMLDGPRRRFGANVACERGIRIDCGWISVRGNRSDTIWTRTPKNIPA